MNSQKKTGQISQLTVEIIAKTDNRELMDIFTALHSDDISRAVNFKLKKYSFDYNDIQDCFAYIINKIIDNNCHRIRAFEGRSSFKTYILSVAGRLIIDFMRSTISYSKRFHDGAHARTDAVIAASFDTSKTANPEEKIIVEENHSENMKAYEKVRTIMSALPEPDKTVVHLKLDQNMTFKEINKIINIRNAAYRFNRSILKIRDAMKQQGITPGLV